MCLQWFQILVCHLVWQKLIYHTQIKVLHASLWRNLKTKIYLCSVLRRIVNLIQSFEAILAYEFSLNISLVYFKTQRDLSLDVSLVLIQTILTSPLWFNIKERQYTFDNETYMHKSKHRDGHFSGTGERVINRCIFHSLCIVLTIEIKSSSVYLTIP